jgi:hypothetical protein
VIYAGAALVVGILFVAGVRWIARQPVEFTPCRRIEPEAYDYEDTKDEIADATAA